MTDWSCVYKQPSVDNAVNQLKFVVTDSLNQAIPYKCTLVAVTKLHASRPRKDFTPLTARQQVNSTALLALLCCELRAVFTRLGSAVCVATLYDFSVTLKHEI
jgi:hypothetical protein